METSIDTIRRQLTNQLTGNLDPEPIQKPASGGNSSYNASLLTPPLSVHSYDAPPFKPKDDDETSLSMKSKKSESRQHLHRANCSAGDVEDIGYEDSVNSMNSMKAQAGGRRLSLPEIKQLSSFYLQPGNSHAIQQTESSRRSSTDSKRRGLPRRPRRWTMPSKALPAQVQTDTSLPRSFTTKMTEQKSAKTPAMISLRRATTSKPQCMPTNAYTSFPEPSFGRTKSSFLTKIWGGDDGNVDQGNVVMSPARQLSLVATADARTAAIRIAPPVYTDLLAVPFSSEPLRRCSTRYISKNTMYEVIWDENVATSSSDSPSPEVVTSPNKVKSPKLTADPRRHSVAMDKLETELFKAILQSRKSSIVSQKRVNTLEQKKSFQDMLDYKFSRFHHEAQLTNLPRSKANRKHASIGSHAEVKSGKTLTLDCEVGVDYVPPVCNKRGSASSPLKNMESQQESARHVSIREGKRPVAMGSAEGAADGNRPNGYLIGQSAHKRRKLTDLWKPRGSISASMGEKLLAWERKASVAMGNGFNGVDEDERSLLGEM